MHLFHGLSTSLLSRQVFVKVLALLLRMRETIINRIHLLSTSKSLKVFLVKQENGQLLRSAWGQEEKYLVQSYGDAVTH